MVTGFVPAAGLLDDGLRTPTSGETPWRLAALGLLSVRFIQGFIYWGGGSRRFIYAPGKLDPESPHWMANKFQSAMPGAILGADKLIAFLLHHFDILYPALIVFSGLELLCGLGLIAGLLTRLCALGSLCFSVVLMIMFGWQGATCIDEWTMAASNLAMGASLMLLGSGVYSLDNLALKRWPALRQNSGFRWICGSLPLPLSGKAFTIAAVSLMGATAIFNVATYNYFRGSVISPFHSGPVSPSKHHYSLANAARDSHGLIRFHVYLDGGTPAVPSHIVRLAIVDQGGKVLRTWDMAALSALPKVAIHNDFAYNQIKTGPYGLVAEVGAMATITLPDSIQSTTGSRMTILLTNVSNETFRAPVC
ncbi:MAG: TQO small subunit DoxD [Caulobacteraceae bacterium]